MHQRTNGHARQLNERRRSRGKRGQKAGRPLAARCMQIKQKQSARGVYLFWCEKETRRENNGEKKERER